MSIDHKARATAFGAKHAHTRSEKQHDQNFIRDFVGIFTDEDPASVFRFQYPVRNDKGNDGFIDAMWEGNILIEMKSTGKNLEETHETQVLPYIKRLPGRVQPKLRIISDFQNFLVEDPDGRFHKFTLPELPDHLALFTPLFDGLPQYLRTNGTVNERAAKLLADVITGLENLGYPHEHIPAMATRLLFCLYADDNNIWKTGSFHTDVLDSRTDGTDLGLKIDNIFELLNKRKADKTKYKYINGGVFADELPIATFDAVTREALIAACEYDWCGLDPLIFGNIYQSAMNADERHAEGAHYTHEQDILDVLNPILLNDLRARYEAVKHNPKMLAVFIHDLSNVNVLDPACGSGNFLLCAYREVRRIETAAILELQRSTEKVVPSQVTLSQFHGIEYNELSAAIAKTSLWLALHAADRMHADAVGELVLATFPLHDIANIIHGNSATLDWIAEFPGVDVIVGNPPYISNNAQNHDQRIERKALGVKGGKMDYAHIWMVKAAQFITANPSTKSGYVITDSVTQGTQVKGLWLHSAMQGVYTIGGRQSYVWPGDAKVRVVNLLLGSKPEAVGLMAEDRSMVDAEYVSPYLVPSPVPTRELAAAFRSVPSWMVPVKRGAVYGDFGHYAKLGDDLTAIQRDHPEMLINKVSAVNMLSGKPDPVLWFGNRTPAAVKHPAIARRREAVRLARLAAVDRDLKTRGPEWLPWSVVTGEYMGIPKTFSKNYATTPVVIMSGTNYITDTILYAPVDWFMAGLVMSKTATDVQRAKGSKKASGNTAYVQQLLYGMPAPKNDTPDLRAKIAAKAQECVEARPGPAADCMKVTNMPDSLENLHHELDALVGKWWG